MTTNNESNKIRTNLSSLSRVELKDIDVDSSKELIDYMYTGELPITESNVQMLLITANLFGMINIKV